MTSSNFSNFKVSKIAVKIVALCVAGLLLTACAHKHPDQSAINDANMAYSAGDQARASGLGAEGGFGDQAGSESAEGRSLVAHRTYYFDFDSNIVREDDKPAIAANARFLVSHPNMHVEIIAQGHTDPRGSREYNIGLGERRAKAVAAILVAHGVNPDRIHVVSYGSEKLAAPGRTEADYQLDRRVVLVYQR